VLLRFLVLFKGVFFMESLVRNHWNSQSDFVFNTVFKVLFIIYSTFYRFVDRLPIEMQWIRFFSWIIVIYGFLVLLFDFFGKKNYFSSKESRWFLLSVFFLLFSIINQHSGVWETVKWDVHLVLMMFLLLQYPVDMTATQVKKQLVFLGKILFVLFLGYSVASLLGFLTGKVIRFDEFYYYGFFEGRLDCFLQMNTLGSTMVFFALVSIYCLVKEEKRVKRFFFFFCILLALITLSLTQSRGATVAFSFSFSFGASVYILRKKQKPCRFFTFTITIAAIALMVILYLFISGFYPFLVKGHGILSKGSEHESLTMTNMEYGRRGLFIHNRVDTTDRITIWKETLAIIKKHPLTGSGSFSSPDSLLIQEAKASDAYQLKKVYYKTHNNILQIALMNGIPFALCLVVVILTYGFRFLKRILSGEWTLFEVLFLSLGCEYLLLSMIESFVAYPWGLSLFIFCQICSYYGYYGSNAPNDFS